MSGASALYAGEVMHVRLKPRRHRLAYRLFSLLLDLDEIDGLDRRLRLFSRGRFNLFSFHDRDYADPAAGPLKAQVERLLAAGASRVGEHTMGDFTWTVLADPQGNRFCVFTH